MLRLGRYLLGNTVKAGIFALALLLLPWPFSLAAAVVVGLMTLARGFEGGAHLLAWVVLPAAAATWKAPSVAIPYDLAFLVCVLTWGYAGILRSTRNWSRMLELSTAVGLVYIAVLQWLPSTWTTQATAYLEHLVLDYMAQVMPADANAYHQMLASIAPYLLGSLYAVFAMMATVVLMLSRLWQLHLSAPGERRLEFYGMRIDPRVAVVAIAVMGASYVWQFSWLMVAAQVVVVPFVFNAVSLLIYLLKVRLQANRVMQSVGLVLGIMAMVLLPKVLLGFVVLGFVDSLLNVRKLSLFRIKRASS